MRELANPVASIVGTTDAAQIGDASITTAKLSSAAKQYVNFGCFNVKEYGAVGDGVTNDATAIQDAINAAEVIGGTVLFPAGTYYVGTELTVAPATLGVKMAFIGLDNATITTDLLPVQNTGKILFKVENTVDSFTVRGLKFRNTRQAETIDGYGALTCFSFEDGTTGRTQSDINFFDCEFWSFMIDINLFNDTTGYLRRFVVNRCKFLADIETHTVSYSGTVAKFTAIRCYQQCYDIIITDCIYDGCTGNSVVNWTNKLPRDGFIFFTLPQRCLIANNIVRNLSVEGIYCINWTEAGPSANEASANQVIISNNLVNGAQPIGGTLLGAGVAIRTEVAGCVISGNRIRGCQGGILVAPQATAYVDTIGNLIIGNSITMLPKAKVNEAAYGITINPTVGTTDAGYSTIRGNQIDWLDSYSDGNPGTVLYHRAIEASAGYVTIDSNTVIVRTKAGGTSKACGITVGNGLTKANAMNNTFINCDIAFYFGNAVYLRGDNNRLVDCTEYAAGNFTLGSFGRTAIEFTPSATGWHRILYHSRQARGRLTIGMDYDYGTGDVGTANQSRLEVEFCTNLTGKKIKIDVPDFQNTQVITGVRFADSFYLDINIASVGSTPKRILIQSECEDTGLFLIDPMQSSANQNVTASSTQLTATIPNDAQVVEVLAVAAASSDQTGGGIVTYVGTNDPSATPPTGATQGSQYIRVGGTNGNRFVYKNTTWTAV